MNVPFKRDVYHIKIHAAYHNEILKMTTWLAWIIKNWILPCHENFETKMNLLDHVEVWPWIDLIVKAHFVRGRKQPKPKHFGLIVCFCLNDPSPFKNNEDFERVWYGEQKRVCLEFILQAKGMIFKIDLEHMQNPPTLEQIQVHKT